MRRCIVVSALTGLLFVAFFVNNADAVVVAANPYGGHASSHCESPTHLSYYDPRNRGQTVYSPDSGGGDSVYYVDTNPLAGFQPTSTSYSSTQTPDQDCKGTPVLRTTAYAAVSLSGSRPEIAFPTCPRADDRNPGCANSQPVVQGAVYVGSPDKSTGVGEQGAVIP
jgi:hypothetical protein